jgi:hypothetical protein
MRSAPHIEEITMLRLVLICTLAFALSTSYASQIGRRLTQQSRVPVSGVVMDSPELDSRVPQSSYDDYGPNVKMNQDVTTRRQNEITMCAWVQDPRIVMGGSNDYRNGDASGGFYVSTNGGATFADALVTRGPAGVYEAAGDPVTAIAYDGTLFANYICFDRTTDDGGLYVQSSTNNGATWSAPLVIAEHIGNPTPDFEDKPYAVCDIVPTSPYVNRHYVSWTRFYWTGGSPIYVSHSTGGATPYSAPLRISTSDGCQFSCPCTGPNGEVYVVWYDYYTGMIQLDRSYDGGNTWGADLNVAAFDDVWGVPNPCGTFRTPSYPVITCDLSNGPRRGWLYLSWASYNGSDPDVWLTTSADGGNTWTAPVVVHSTTDSWQWWQWIAVNPESGDLGIGWLDRRDDVNDCLYRPYATISQDGGVTFAPEFPISTVMCNPTITNFLGDYNGAAFRHGNSFYYGWVDTRSDVGDAYSTWFRLAPPAPQGLVVIRDGDHARLHWNSVEAATYEVYRSVLPGGPFTTLVAATPDTFLLDLNAVTNADERYYQVVAVED